MMDISTSLAGLANGPSMRPEQSLRPDTAVKAFEIKSDYATGLRDPKELFTASAQESEATGKTPSIGDMVGNFISEVDAKQKDKQTEIAKTLSGQSDNMHRSIIAMQEASAAFSVMLEFRNKLVEGYQELMRMSV